MASLETQCENGVPDKVGATRGRPSKVGPIRERRDRKKQKRFLQFSGEFGRFMW